MIRMHDRIQSQQLLRKTAFDDPDAPSDTVVAVTQENRFWWSGCMIGYSCSSYSGKQLLMIRMHNRIQLKQLLRKTTFDDPDARSDTVVAVTQENSFWWSRCMIWYSRSSYSGKQLLMIWMHDRIQSYQLLRKTPFDDPDAWSDTVVAVTQENSFWWSGCMIR